MNALAPIAEQKALIARTADESRQPLFILFAAYPEPWSDKQAEKGDELMNAKVNAYLLGLDKLPRWAIHQAVTDFIQGRIERPARRRGALPTVEELATEARIHIDREASKQRAEAVREEQSAPSPFPEDHRLRMKFKYAVLLAGLHRKQVEKVRLANDRGFEDLIALAQEWRMPIPESFWSKPL